MSSTISKCFTGFASRSCRLSFGRSLSTLIHTGEVMTKQELINKLEALSGTDIDPEIAHVEADKLLIEFIGDSEIKEAFDGITKYYI